MKLQGKKIGIFIEGDWYEKEIFYYIHRFAEEGAEVHWLTRLWGQPKENMSFLGHEYKVKFDPWQLESFEGIDDETLKSFSALIVPSAIVSDRLRYTTDVHVLPPAVDFLARAFAEKAS